MLRLSSIFMLALALAHAPRALAEDVTPPPSPVDVKEFLLTDDEISNLCSRNIYEQDYMTTTTDGASKTKCEAIYLEIRAAAKDYKDEIEKEKKLVADQAGDCNFNTNQALCLGAAKGNATLIAGAHSRIMDCIAKGEDQVTCAYDAPLCTAQKANELKMTKSDQCYDQTKVGMMSDDCLNWADYLWGTGPVYPPPKEPQL